MALLDGRSIRDGEVLETDVCVIGAGAAGITLALEFRGAGFRTLLLESGGDHYDADTQALYRGENVGREYYALDTCRLRYLGGTTNHWSNWCSPFDEEDFEVRPWIPHSGWPFSRASVDGAYQRAHVLAGLGPYEWDDLEFWTTPGGGRPIPLDGVSLQSRFIQIGTPKVQFGRRYREELDGADAVRTLIWSNATELEFAPDSDRIARVAVKTLAGNAFAVEAKIFVLAAGGIENPRLMLASRSSRPAGIGNDRDLVGRFFQEHVNQFVGRFLISDPSTDFSFYADKRRLHGARAHGYIRITRDRLREEGLPGVSFYFRPTYSDEVAEGVDSARLLRDALREGTLPEAFWTHLWNVVTDFDQVAEEVYRRYAEKPIQGRVYRMSTRVEQQPDPANRVLLSDDKDALGLPRAKLDWRYTERDRRALLRGQRIAAEELAKAGAGRANFLEFDPTDAGGQEVDHLFGGCHHMGTTRISADPQTGVADPNCRVFGTKNLYVAGSSVFPTSGQCNPTLSIVALAVRLADHIKGELA